MYLDSFLAGPVTESHRRERRRSYSTQHTPSTHRPLCAHWRNKTNASRKNSGIRQSSPLKNKIMRPLQTRKPRLRTGKEKRQPKGNKQVLSGIRNSSEKCAAVREDQRRVRRTSIGY